jgi:hypothetical protein
MRAKSRIQLRAMSGAFIGLCREDEKKAEEIYSAYTATLPLGPEHDAVTSAFAIARQASPGRALDQAMTIRDSAIRQNTMDSIMSDWIFTNAKGAQYWLASSKTLPAAWVNKWQAKMATR